MKPNWFVRKFRLWALGCCPWCGKKLERGFAGIFLNGVKRCPDGHYAEEVVAYSGTLVYEDGGRDMRDPPAPPEPPKEGVVIDISSKRPKRLQG